MISYKNNQISGSPQGGSFWIFKHFSLKTYFTQGDLSHQAGSIYCLIDWFINSLVIMIQVCCLYCVLEQGVYHL